MADMGLKNSKRMAPRLRSERRDLAGGNISKNFGCGSGKTALRPMFDQELSFHSCLFEQIVGALARK
jgi:hypothetical protein